MVKWLKVGALAVVALLVAASASGDSNTYNYQGTGPYFNPKSGQKVDATGNAQVVDADRDRDYVVSYDNIIADTTATYMADSSAVYATGSANRLYLYVRVTGFTGGVASAFSKLAIEVRSHTNGLSDSTNTFVWDPTPRSATATSEADSITFGSATAPTTATLVSTDLQAILTADMQVASKWGRPHTLVIPLVSSTGSWYWGEYTSVKYRVLAASNTPLTYSVSLRGRP